MGGTDQKILRLLQGGEGAVDGTTGDEMDGTGLYPAGRVMEDHVLRPLDVSGSGYRTIPLSPEIVDCLGGTQGSLADVIARTRESKKWAGAKRSKINPSPRSAWIETGIRPTWTEIEPE